jgi:hypothetical protein
MQSGCRCVHRNEFIIIGLNCISIFIFCNKAMYVWYVNFVYRYHGIGVFGLATAERVELSATGFIQ